MKIHNTCAVVLMAGLIVLGPNSGSIRAQDTEPQDAIEELKSELIQAVLARDVAVVRRIIKSNPELADSRFGPDVPLLLFAAFSKNEHGFIRQEENELVSIIRPHIKEPGIFEASVTGNLKRVKNLIERRPALVDSAAVSGWTLMHFAAFSGNVDLVKYLHDRGGDIQARAWQSSLIVPLLSGMLVKRYEVSELLLDLGADPLIRESGGFSAMHEVANLGDTALIRLLYDRGAELNSRRDDGDRPIDLAAKHNFPDAVALLKELGAEE